MAVEVGLATVVLIAGGLFLQRFGESRDTDPHFRRDGLWVAAYDLSGRNLNGAASRVFASRVLDDVRALPYVDSAAIASAVPLDIHGLGSRTFSLEGHARSDGRLDEALTNTVTPGYFSAMGIPLTAGRDFADLSDPAAPAQAIVNTAFVREFLPGSDPLGRSLESRGQRFVIAGVVATSTYQSFGEPPTPIIYVSYRDRPVAAGEIHVFVRPGGDTRLAGDLRRAINGIDPTVPLYNVRTMPEHIERNLFLRRIPARIFMVLGPLLLLLAALGIYGVVSHSVARRTREIAVRLALGASRRRVIALTIAECLIVVGLGAGAGWLLAYDVYLQVVGIGAIDLPVFVGIPFVLLVISTCAAWLPARRAGRIAPAEALKE